MLYRFLFVLVMLLSFSSSTYADTNGIWITAGDIKAGNFGSDEGGGNFVFPNDLSVTNTLNSDLLQSTRIISTTANITSSLEANSLEVVNKITSQSLDLKGNAGSLDIKGIDHAYLEFFPQGTTRKAWIGFGSAGTEILSIQSEAGNLALNPNGYYVGIGTSNPTQKLDVNGDLRIRSSIYSDGPIYENGKRVATQDDINQIKDDILIKMTGTMTIVEYHDRGDPEGCSYRFSSSFKNYGTWFYGTGDHLNTAACKSGIPNVIVNALKNDGFFVIGVKSSWSGSTGTLSFYGEQ